ncbi:unnamed protein product [Tetraodon nigroviridis]|uniref:(spotted green pufferfish) hypothetical protein n=1 Tax=Tetraodon nigroviridis TaxID=99883 RepID=Q4SKS7_TETNG|nr:unnamed protein product [Tetraodon nigroviridis]
MSEMEESGTRVLTWTQTPWLLRPQVHDLKCSISEHQLSLFFHQEVEQWDEMKCIIPTCDAWVTFPLCGSQVWLLQRGSGHAPVILQRLFSSVQDHPQQIMCFLFHFIWGRRRQREDSVESLSVCSLIMVWFSDVGPILAFKEIRVGLSQLVAGESFLCHRDSRPAIISIPEEGLPVSPVPSTPVLPPFVLHTSHLLAQPHRNICNKSKLRKHASRLSPSLCGAGRGPRTGVNHLQYVRRLGLCARKHDQGEVFRVPGSAEQADE